LGPSTRDRKGAIKASEEDWKVKHGNVGGKREGGLGVAMNEESERITEGTFIEEVRRRGTEKSREEGGRTRRSLGGKREETWEGSGTGKKRKPCFFSRMTRK